MARRPGNSGITGLGIAPGPPQAEVQQLIALVKAGRHRVVEQKAKRLLKAYPDALILYNLMSVAQIGQKQFAGAVKTLEKALELNPDFIDGEYNLALSLMNLNRLPEAIHHFKNVVAKKPDFAEAHNNLGAAWLELNNVDEAINHYRKAVELKPKFIPALRNLGAALRDIGHLEESLVHLAKVPLLQPRFAIGHYSLGVTHKALGNLDKAISCFKTALILNPDLDQVHYEFGGIYREQGELDKARAAFEKVDNSIARTQVLEMLFEAGHKQEFLKGLARMNAAEPKNLRASALSVYASQQYGLENTHPFCRDPLDYVSIKSIKPYAKEMPGFLDALMEAAEALTVVWEHQTTKGGFQTHGNLFDSDLGIAPFAKLEEIIRHELEQYRNLYAASKDDIIRDFPEKFELSGWRVKLMKSGHQKTHIHSSGWVSGVIYLKVPSRMSGEEGAIEFSLRGYSYPVIKKDVPGKLHIPSEGELVLFPSSLFHKTIPFDSDEERQCIAFDVVPKREENS